MTDYQVIQAFADRETNFDKRYVSKTNRLSWSFFFKKKDGAPQQVISDIVKNPPVPLIEGASLIPWIYLPYGVYCQWRTNDDYYNEEDDSDSDYGRIVDWLASNTEKPWNLWTYNRKDIFLFASKRDADMFLIFKRLGTFGK